MDPKKRQIREKCGESISWGDVMQAARSIFSAKRKQRIRKMSTFIMCIARNHVMFVFTFAVPYILLGKTCQIISY